MTFPKKTALLLAALVLVVPLSSCDPTDQNKLYVTGPYFTGYEAKDVYNAYLGSSIATLNSAKSQSASDVRHLANFVDGLLMNNEFGILERQLASSASVDTEFQNFYFTIKEGVAWYTHEGNEFKATNDLGQEVVQYVKADDFVNTAEIILNYANGSEIAYMVTMFIDGGWEYYCYTEMLKLIKDRNTNYAGINWMTLKSATNDAKANALMQLISYESGMDLAEVPLILGEDLDAIANFSRVGVTATSEYKLHYRLNQPARFFPTLLTYAPFYPINRAFFNQHKFSGFGTSREKMLYNGPYICSEWGDTKIQYTRNENYYNVSDVHIKTVNYTIAPDTISYADMREDFEEGIIDGFTVAKEDAVGWENYITGPDNSGTVQNPYSPLVNSRELNLIDYTWHFVLNVERETDLSLQPNTIFGASDSIYAADEIVNTNRALKIKEVRRLILDGIDFEDYNQQNEATADDIHQYQLNTLTPPGYVFDENDKDYLDYYYEEYAEQKGLADAAAAKALVGPQTIEGANYSDAEVLVMRAEAEAAVAKYNAEYPDAPIRTPIIIENAGLAGYGGSSYNLYENLWINGFNSRVNEGLTAGNEFVKIVNNLKTTSSTAATNNAYAAYYTLNTWGWIGDYADPLTYLHTYVTNGDMSLFTGTKAARDNYYVNESGDLVSQVGGLLEDYDDMVDEAKAITSSNTLRYQAFAEAEYKLINDVHIIKPHSMNSQGWAVSVSRAIGYENPTASYGLADYRLTGMWVLVNPPTGQERQVARDLQATAKAAALEATGVYNYIGSDEE